MTSSESRTAPRGRASLKRLDRYLGVPLLRIAGLLPKRRKPETVRTIALMKTAAIGDTLLMCGLVDDVRAEFRDARITLITGADNAAAAELIGRAADARVVVSPRSLAASVRAVRAVNADILVDFGSWPRFDALLAALSGARFRVGFKTAAQARHFAFDAVVEHSSNMHERTNYERLVAAIGVRARTVPRIVPDEISPALIPASPFVVFHAWAAGFMHEAKEWPNDRWSELAERLPNNVHVVITGSASDRDRSAMLQGQLRSRGIQASDVSGRYSLRELATVFARSEAVVSVNTGVAHLAALVGARTVSLEGPTPVRRWAPLGERVRCVESSLDGCGYLNLGFEYRGRRLDCMSGITADAVARAVRDLMAEQPNAPPA